MSDLKEFERLVLTAKKNLPSNTLVIQCGFNGLWTILKDGPATEDCRDLTFLQVAEKLQEWAKPKKVVTVAIPISDAEEFTHRAWSDQSVCGRISNNLKKAIKEATGL